MARTRIHTDDAVLEATADLVLRRGARAASIKAIGAASGAPVGSLYHRFGSRDGVLLALWERAVRRFHEAYLPQEGVPGSDPVATGVGMARAVVAFSRSHPSDARLLMTLRPEDLLDGEGRLEQLNAGVIAAVQELSRALDVGAERVRMAVVDLPYGSVRRHLGQGRPVPQKLEAEIGEAARLLLTTPATPSRGG